MVDLPWFVYENGCMGIQARLFGELKRGKAAARLVAGGALTSAAGGLLALAQAGLVARLLDLIIFRGEATSSLAPFFTALVAVVAGRALLAAAGEYLASLGALHLKMKLREELFAKITRLGPAFLAGRESGEVSASLADGIDALETYFSQYLPQVILAAVIPLGILLFVLPLDLLTGAILLVTAPLIPLFMYLIGVNSEKLTRRQWSALGKMSAFFLDTLQGLQELKLLGRSRERGEKIRQVSEQYRETTLEVMRLTFLSALALEWLSTLSTAVIAVQIGLRLLAGGLAFEQAFFILVIAPDFYLPLRNLGLRFHAGMAGQAAARKIYEIFDRAEPRPAAGTARHAFDPSGGVEIEFHEVSFTYPDSAGHALEEVSLKIGRGEFHALAGRNGAGKSTLAALLLGFIEPGSGEILVNGRPLEEIGMEAWRRTFAWVPQRPYLFSGSLADNIRLGRPEAELDEVTRAARAARMDAFIESLPEGYETVIDERGARLSGGQAQRLALARAFLMERPFLILDEPASHLDLPLELDLTDVIRSLTKGRTTLMIAHRLPGLRQADCIHFLENGRLAESGPYGELLAGRGGFYNLLRGDRP